MQEKYRKFDKEKTRIANMARARQNRFERFLSEIRFLRKQLVMLRKENIELKINYAHNTIGQGMITSGLDRAATSEAILRDILKRVKCEKVRLFRIVNDGEKKMIIFEKGLTRDGELIKEYEGYPIGTEKTLGYLSPLAVQSKKIQQLKCDPKTSFIKLYELEISKTGIKRKEVSLTDEEKEKLFETANKWKVWEKVTLPIIETKRLENGQETEEVIGIMTADNSKTNFPIADSRIFVLSRAAQLAAVQLKNADLYEETQAQATKDALTGIANRRYFEEELRKEIKKSIRYGHPLSLVMLDIDYFKNINDTYGHIQGDKVLKKIARLVESTIRADIDVVARYGGEEFAIILPETDKEEALVVAEYIRKIVNEQKFELEKGRKNISINITISLGIADIITAVESLKDSLESGEQGLYNDYKKYSEYFVVEENKINFDEMEKKLLADHILIRNVFVNCADLALYDAKGKYDGAGRDRVKIFNPNKEYNGGV